MDNDATLTIRQAFDREDDTIRILTYDGYINFETYDIAKNAINRLLESGLYKIVFDLSRTKYISSSGWAIFIGPLASVHAAGGDLKLAAMSPEVSFIFEALELDNMLNSYNTVEDAIAAFKK